MARPGCLSDPGARIVPPAHSTGALLESRAATLDEALGLERRPDGPGRPGRAAAATQEPDGGGTAAAERTRPTESDGRPAGERLECARMADQAVIWTRPVRAGPGRLLTLGERRRLGLSPRRPSPTQQRWDSDAGRSGPDSRPAVSESES